jgi:hypothetical protein
MAEIIAGNLPPVHFDVLSPADKKRVAEHHMEAIDKLPYAVRHAIHNAAWDPRIKVVDDVVNEVGQVVSTVDYLDYSHLAVKMLDKGLTVEQVVNHINNLDALSTKVERTNGTIPPEGKAT